MSSASTVTYTSVYTNFEPGRVFWGADEELSDRGSLQVIIYGYDELPMQSVAPPSPDYVPGPEYPSSPDYVPDLEHPPSPAEEDQPLPADASPVALSPGYVADSDSEEDPEEDHADIIRDDNNEEEEKHLALADSPAIPIVDPIPSVGDTEAFETDEGSLHLTTPRRHMPRISIRR
ncbi:hypothetical protein Tco_0849895 [Tanacetum coccineum]